MTIMKQPEKTDEKELNSIVEDKADTVTLRGRKWKVKWMKNGTKRKVTDILLTEKDELKVTTKCVAAMLLNGYWKIRFFYWILWRWIYYVKQCDESELLGVLEVCKKKVQLTEYYINTILLTELRDTIQGMTREEAERIRQEQISAMRGQQERKGHT